MEGDDSDVRLVKRRTGAVAHDSMQRDTFL
jgi:hypothetical protein